MLNIVGINGRFVADPELKTTNTGTPVCTFTIACDRSYVKSGEERQADFIDCVAWRNTAEFICRYFSKGSMIGIDGSIQTRMYEDKDGKKHKVTEVVVNNAHFCGAKEKTENPIMIDKPVEQTYTRPTRIEDYTEEDIPF